MLEHWQQIYTAVVVILLIVFLVRDTIRPVLLFLSALAALLFAGVVSPAQAFSGFSNPAVFTVGALFIVAASVQHTGAIDGLARYLLPTDKGVTSVIFRLTSFTSFSSAFLNNTPIVAMLIPQIQRWSQLTGISSSRVLIPLSYAAIVGGIITLIGTSTNLIVSGMLSERGYEPFTFFELTWIGLPASVVVFLYMSLVMHRYLPEYNTRSSSEITGEYQYDLEVPEHSELVGKTIDECGLRHLEIAYIVHVKRGKHLIGPIGPKFVIEGGDKLTFVGDHEHQDTLIREFDLVRAVPELDESDDRSLPIYEAVVASSSRLVGRSLKETNFREYYRGVVVAIQRNNQLIRESLGNLKIQTGDLLLIEAKEGFDQRWNTEKGEFYLVVEKGESIKPLSSKAPLAIIITLLMVLLAAFEIVPIVITSLIAAVVMVMAGCLPENKVPREINLPILAVIAAALGVGQAVEASGLAQTVSDGLLFASSGMGIIAAIAVIYIVTNVLTEIVTNNAAAVLMVPTSIIMAYELGVDPHAFAVTVAVAASASFLSPFGYQTNLMVMGAGKYKFLDYTKAGFPITLFLFCLTVVVVYLKWI